MAFYESIFIVRPSVTDEETSKVVEKMKAVLERTGATILKTENWGKKKLAYEVKRERKGTFMYVHFEAGNTTVGELERSYRIEDAIIKFMTIRLEEAIQPPEAAGTAEPEKTKEGAASVPPSTGATA